MNLYSFTKQPNSDGIYFVDDRMSNPPRVGKVARVGRIGWIAVPVGEQTNDHPRIAHESRARAAHCLARFNDDGNPDWINAKVKQTPRYNNGVAVS